MFPWQRDSSVTNAGLSKSVIPSLTKARKHKDARVRKLASCALAFIQRGKASPDLVDGLIEAVNDKEIEVKENALDSLARVGPAAKPALPALQDLLKEKTDPGIRFKAVMAISAIAPKTQTTIDLLIKTLQRNNPDARERSEGSAMQFSRVADKLGRIGPPAKGAIEPLSRALSDPAAIVRVSAAFALSRIAPEKTREMVRVLIELLKSQDPSVRSNTIRALVEIGPMAKEATVPLADLIRTEKDPFVREMAVGALKRIPPDDAQEWKK